MTTFMQSPNHASRNGVKVDSIVVHWMDGTLAAADATFANAAGQTSAHYGVEDTTVHQYVLDSDVAWHSGDWNENQRSIGIEHSGGELLPSGARRPVSPETIATSVALIVSLCRAHGISPDHIYPHNKFYSTQCPGTLPVAAMIASVRLELGKPAPTTVPPTVPKEDNTMRPWFIRARTGAIVIVTPTGVRPVTPAQWTVWTHLGFHVEPSMSAMDSGPFQEVIASLGGLVK